MHRAVFRILENADDQGVGLPRLMAVFNVFPSYPLSFGIAGARLCVFWSRVYDVQIRRVNGQRRALSQRLVSPGSDCI